MKKCIDRHSETKTFEFFRRSPGFSLQRVHIFSKHGTCVIERKQRIKKSFLKLTLTRHSPPLPLCRFVNGKGEFHFNFSRIEGILIRFNDGVGFNKILKVIQKPETVLLSMIWATTIFFQ